MVKTELPIKAQKCAKDIKQNVIYTEKTNTYIPFSGTASSCSAETFALAVFSPSRSTEVQLRNEENSILDHSLQSGCLSLIFL